MQICIRPVVGSLILNSDGPPKFYLTDKQNCMQDYLVYAFITHVLVLRHHVFEVRSPTCKYTYSYVLTMIRKIFSKCEFCNNMCVRSTWRIHKYTYSFVLIIIREFTINQKREPTRHSMDPVELIIKDLPTGCIQNL